MTRTPQTELRRPVNVSIAAPLVEAAKALGINLSRACEVGIEAAVNAARARQWQEENRAAFESYNEWVEKNGIPLREFRQF